MSLNSTCHACQMGDHKHHQKSIQPAPEGGVGGVACTCQGECEDGRYKKSFEELMGYGRRS